MAYGLINADQIGTSVANTSLGAGDASLMKNRIINGAMVIDQRNAGSAVTISGASAYGLDRWALGYITSGTYTGQQVSDAPAGFTYSNKLSVTVTTTANDVAFPYQRIEGFNAQDLGWGTANATPVTLSFWVKANNTGTYCAVIQYYGSTANYYYVSPYTISVANTWTQITINVTGAPVGAGAFTAAGNTSYIQIVPVVIGSSGQTGTATANTWSSSNGNYKTSGSFNLASTASATFQFTGVQLEVGSIATGYEYRQYGQELNLCQRYLYTSGGSFNGNQNFQQYSSSGYATSSTNAYFVIPLPVTMRASPSYSYTGISNFAVQYSGGTVSTPSASSLDIASPTSAGIQFTVSGMSAGQLARLYQNATNATSLQFSAEL